jgi:uncharacterized membrane protein YqhA
MPGTVLGREGLAARSFGGTLVGMRNILASSRYFIGAAVLGTFLSSVVLIIAGVLAVFEIAWHQITDGEIGVESARELSFEFIELIDIFLLGTVLYIIALGLYELFVDPELPLPQWLVITDFDELKQKLIGIIIVLLGVTFLGAAVNWQSGNDILYLGIGTALVIFALAIALYLTHRAHLETHPVNHSLTRARNKETNDHA